MSGYTCCDGVTRRDFLRAGALAGVGLSLPNFLAMNAGSSGSWAARGNRRESSRRRSRGG